MAEGKGGTSQLDGPVSVPAVDPLLMCIAAYRNSLKEFDSKAPHGEREMQALAAATYLRHRKVLERYGRAAATRLSATAALEMALDADRDGDAALVAPMIRAALGFITSGD